MKKHLLIAAALVLTTGPALSAPWVRGFVVDNYEPAFYYGGRSGTEEPGSDCPKGTIQILDYKKVLKTSWRTDAEIEKITLPVSAGGLGERIVSPAMQHRGFRRDIDTYINPFTAPDAGMQQVTGKIAEGFDLDNNSRTGGFTSPEGQRGIDNAFYRVMGCHLSYRGAAYKGYLTNRGNDKMLEGLYTMVIRISGNQDPMNDNDATVEIGYSPDKIVRDARANVAPDYSYRMVKSEQYTKLKARIVNGVVETEQVGELHVPRIGWFPDQMGDADFHKGKLKLKIDADGRNASGFVGGYRNWLDLLSENTFAQTGAEQGIRDHEDAVGLYYALKRNADGMPDPKTGRNTGISMAYRIKAVPAHVVDPAAPAQVRRPAEDEKRRKGFEMVKAAMVKAVSTRIVQEVPLGTGEAQFPAMERTIADLPSKDFFLQHFDAPGKLDENGKVIMPKPKSEPQRQVKNGVATAVASAQDDDQ